MQYIPIVLHAGIFGLLCAGFRKHLHSSNNYGFAVLKFVFFSKDKKGLKTQYLKKYFIEGSFPRAGQCVTMSRKL